MNLEAILKKNLDLITPNHPIKEVYEYALFPTGKLLRAHLMTAFYQDLNCTTDKNLEFAFSFIEFHHAYSLIHDDLPMMDNDDIRRGKPTVHKKFNEWKAILAGDGLICGSFEMLSKIRHEKLNQILRFATFATGPKGLVLGQVLDLNQEMNESLKKLILTHKLKTGKLFQLCFVIPYYLSLKENENSNLKKIFKLYKLGSDLGLIFQFTDDLLELCDQKISKHEFEINPFINHRVKCLDLYIEKYQHLFSVLKTNYPNTYQTILKKWLNTSVEKIKNEKMNLENHGINTSKLISIF